jgi:hypothetical protein
MRVQADPKRTRQRRAGPGGPVISEFLCTDGSWRRFHETEYCWVCHQRDFRHLMSARLRARDERTPEVPHAIFWFCPRHNSAAR